MARRYRSAKKQLRTLIAPAISDPRSPAIASEELIHPNVLLGLPLSSPRAASTSASETAEKSVPLGKHCLTSRWCSRWSRAATAGAGRRSKPRSRWRRRSPSSTPSRRLDPTPASATAPPAARRPSRRASPPPSPRRGHRASASAGTLASALLLTSPPYTTHLRFRWCNLKLNPSRPLSAHSCSSMRAFGGTVRCAGSVPPRQRAAPVVRRPIALRPNNAPPGNTPRYATISICSHDPSARGTSTVR